MNRPAYILGVAALAAMLAYAAVTAAAQDYPMKSIRIVTSEAGGGNDLASRLIGQGLSAVLGQPVITDNRGISGYDLVAKASADGYTLLLHGAPFWLAPLLQKMPYDPVRDFAPITLAIRQPNMIVVHPSLAATSVKELIALAKAKPDELNYGAASLGSSSHLAAELFKSMAGVRITRIGYKSGGAASTALLAGEVQMLFVSVASSAPFVKTGKLRALAVTSAEPSVFAPGYPTVAASGLPGFEAVSMAGVFAPAKTPAAIITRLNREIVRVLHEPGVKDRLFNTGVEVIGNTPAQLAAIMKSEMTRYGKVIKDAGIRIE
jgi:tripartite-type tricarboxylate transporter receptor subunit TctC